MDHPSTPNLPLSTRFQSGNNKGGRPRTVDVRAKTAASARLVALEALVDRALSGHPDALALLMADRAGSVAPQTAETASRAQSHRHDRRGHFMSPPADLVPETYTMQGAREMSEPTEMQTLAIKAALETPICRQVKHLLNKYAIVIDRVEAVGSFDARVRDRAMPLSDRITIKASLLRAGILV
jgi:hypothetical protein